MATWCGPCRESFAHVKPLQEYAKKNDIVLLYLSIDRPDDDAKMAQDGNSLWSDGRACACAGSFQKRIYDTFGNERGALSIPRCVIIGKDGKVKFAWAASPENMEELASQLAEASKEE